MTTKTATPTKQAAESKKFAKLRDDQRACLSCGIAVDEPAESWTFTSLAREGEDPIVAATRASGAELGYSPRPALETELSKCEQCTERHALAEVVASQWPEVRGRLGNVARHRLAQAMDAYAALGVEPPSIDTPQDALQLVADLSDLGASARWSARYGLVADADARKDQRAPTPWSHVDDEARAEIAAVIRRQLAVRVARSRPPVTLLPRSGGGCAACGVGAVEVPAAHVARLGGLEAARADAWRVLDISPQALGAQFGGARVRSVFCPRCRSALESVGVVGLEAMVRSLRDWLTEAGRTREAGRLSAWEAVGGLVGWQVLAEQRRRAGKPVKPNAEPWAHVRVSG